MIVNLNIPDDLEALLRDVEGGAEAFFLQTVREKLTARREADNLLAEGYQAGHDEVRDIMEDFKYAGLLKQVDALRGSDVWQGDRQ